MTAAERAEIAALRDQLAEVEQRLAAQAEALAAYDPAAFRHLWAVPATDEECVLAIRAAGPERHPRRQVMSADDVKVIAGPGYVTVIIPCEAYVPGPGDPGVPGLFQVTESPAATREWARGLASRRDHSSRALATILREAADVAEQRPDLHLIEGESHPRKSTKE
jgi:hypothetical protein